MTALCRCLLLLLLVLPAPGLQAQLRLPALISHNMVLQQRGQAALWGWAAPREKVTITTGWNHRTHTVTADSGGRWKTYVATGRAGGPYTITFKGRNTIKVEGVMLGEVWLASGQSNMEFFVGKMPNPSYTGVLRYEEEIRAADYPAIRMLDVANRVADTPQEDCTGTWKVCSPQTADTFSAVAYFFARKLHRETGYPVGIINASWGGTPAEAWTKKEVLQNDPALKGILDAYAAEVERYPAAVETYRQALAAWRQDTGANRGAAPREPVGPGSHKSPYKLYNGMIAPVVPYTLRGVIWYQGENNADRPVQYQQLFPALIRSWRRDWRNEALPFYFVQIAPHRSQHPGIREAQWMTYLSVPGTGMVVTTDGGDSLDIHPRDKKPVGERLALWALRHQYGQRHLVYSGPLFQSWIHEGDRLRILFKHAEGGLVSGDGQPLREFTIAGKDGVFVPAQARIDGEAVVVWSEAVREPADVRFAWRNVPRPNLFNRAGLPAAPFRTDNGKAGH